MKRATTIKQDLVAIHTVEDLTEVFESIASLHIAKIRNRVVASKEFFAELWPIYRGLRVDPAQRLKRQHVKSGRNVFVAVTADSKLSGEIDQQVISTLIQAYKDTKDTDILVIGTKGTAQIQAAGLKVAGTFPLPASDVSFSVSDILQALAPYDKIAVFYQTYESLRLQKIARIDLISAVRALGEDVGEEGETVSSRGYIFEPGLDTIANYMESVMMGVALIQIIMESKLAQYAARFNAMNAAKRRAEKLTGEFRTSYYRAKRAESDERLKETLKIGRKAGAIQ
ncbi:MAG TPA: F0F1 ATP synthase subunit gamma [Candidatus Saccharimonadales bacterium]|nr:F0F1 ATP synthase subunit gamma [Candidatus Saccharimonadales bacterium]